MGWLQKLKKLRHIRHIRTLSYQKSRNHKVLLPNWYARLIAKKNKSLPGTVDLMTYDGSGQACHPSVASFKGECYMACTPYPYGNEFYENPCVYRWEKAKNKWNPIADVFPIATPKRLSFEHYSDPVLFCTDDRLFLLFRKCERRSSGKIDQLYISSSEDGNNWLGAELLVEVKGDSVLSPAVDPETGFLFCVEYDGGIDSALMRYAFSVEAGMSKKETCMVEGLDPAWFVWHIDAGRTQGGDLVGLFMLRQKCKTMISKLAIFTYHSEDNTWKWEKDIYLTEEERSEVDFIYKSTWLPNENKCLCSAKDYAGRFVIFEKHIIEKPEKELIDQRIEDAYTIWKKVFLPKTSFNSFCHKHKGNPNADPDTMVLVDYDNHILRGTNSFMGDMLLNGQRKFPVLQSCDTAVLPEHRGKRIFSMLIQQAIDIAQNTENVFIYGFPNQNSYPGFLKLGFFEVGKLEMYTKQLRSGAGSFTKLLRRIYPLPRFKEKSFLDRTGLAWTMSLNCPFNSEDFQIINDRAEIHFQRGAPYFQWKIDQLPVGDAAYLSVRKENGQLDAYFVLRRCSNGICEVCDWMVPEGKEEACRILKELSTFLRCFCSLITVNMVNPAGREPELLTASEFVRQEAQLPFLIYPTSKALSEEDLLQFKTLSNWSLRSIDADTILN